MTADNALYNLQKGRAVIDTLQEQVASGLQVNKPSDDPLTARQLLDLQHQIAQGSQYTSNISKGSTMLNMASTALTGMSDIMTQIKKIAADNVSGSGSQSDRNGVGSSLDALKQQLIDMGNTEYGGQYVFGGFKNNQPPFASNGTFSGTDDDLNVEVAQGSKVSVSVSGGKLLKGTAGGVNILDEIDKLKTAITGNPPDTAAISGEINTMGSAADQVTASLTDVATRLIRLTSAGTLITNNQNTLQNVYGEKQNVDYATLGVELNQQQTAFEAALSATAKISQLSLLNYMS
jgi:flagellar hook-associated protein 3 FlgL